LRDDVLRAEMHSYLGGISRQLTCEPIRIGGVEDHVHILARLDRSTAIADWVKELKRVSSQWIKQRAPSLGDFSWQAGYGVFSVSQSMLETVIAYIGEQEAHHKKTTFQEEYRALLQKHKITWDERYVWE